MRDCTRRGHVLVDDDRACLSCDYEVAKGETVAYHVKTCPECHYAHTPEAGHFYGELLTTADIAHPAEWGALTDGKDAPQGD